MKLSRLRLLVISALLLPPAWAGTATDRMIVKFKPAPEAGATVVRVKRADAVRQASGAAMVALRELADGAQVYQLPSSLDIASAEQLARKIAADPSVAYAEPDRIRKRALMPNDPYRDNQWQLYDTYGARLTSAWDVTTGSSAVVIALVDTGYLPHADLSGRFLPGYDFITDAFIANDGDGRDDQALDPGDWVTQAEIDANPVCDGNVPEDSSWHGLMVAGIAGATGNNAIGVAGMNWGVRLLPVRALGKCGGYMSDIIDGMYWAAGFDVPGIPTNPTPAHIINVSFGSTDNCQVPEQNAINAIVAAGKVVVAAAGNEEADVKTHSPSNCANVIAVGATTRSGSRASYSNFGTGITVSAPVGEDLPEGTYTYSTWNSGTTSPGGDIYGIGDGTSFAAPYVSGIIALMLSVSPNLSPAQIKSIIQSTAQPFPSGSTCTTQICGAGIVDADAAVRTAAATVGTGAPGAISAGSGSTGASSGGGGGGCSTAPPAPIEPTLLALVTIALVNLARRNVT